MKLDNIIYDTDRLAAAITEQWNAESTTFKALYPSETATALVNGFAAYGAMLQYTLVSALANCYTTTAFSEAGIYQLADTLGNSLHGNVSSQVLVTITKNNFIGTNLVIPAHSQFDIAGKKFFNPSAIILPAITNAVADVVLVQGEFLTVNQTSTGIEDEKFYFSSDFKANHNYVKVKVNGEEWNVAESFLPYDKNYVIDIEDMNTAVLHTDPDGRSYIKVGNNQLGSLPQSGSTITIEYVSNDGNDGNISENNVEGSLLSTLMFVDNTGTEGILDVTVTTTTTAYGGFSKQSVAILKHTSPYVFASGNRAVRRQDYEALLENKCGYLTASVWGEYEEADKIGAYDSLMMNMVYYTGVKNFQTYPYFEIGRIGTVNNFSAMLNSTSGFWGSFSYRIQNLKNSSNYFTYEDSGAKGQLFINSNDLDPRDSLLPDWLSTMGMVHIAALPSNAIATAGSNYSVNDELQLTDTNNEIRVRVIGVNETGGVTELALLSSKASKDYTSTHPNPFTTTYVSGIGGGVGLTVRLIISNTNVSSTIYTNDDRGMIPAPAQAHPIENARSDQPDEVYYQSIWAPSLLQPVQIILDYGKTDKAIVGVKFKAADPSEGKFIGTIAMFGTNLDPMPSLDNIRNSENWDKVIERTYVVNPYNNSNDNWTDWYATNCFTGEKDINSQPEYNRYKHYVLEIYSVDDEEDQESPVTFSKIKLLYEDQASLLYYNNNGETEIKFPVAGAPGPGGTADGYLTTTLLNTSAFPLYGYDVTIENVTAANGYRDGNILAYKFKNGDTSVLYLVEVVNIDNGIFKIKVDGSEILNGTEYVQLVTPASLDEELVYKATLTLDAGHIPNGTGGVDYRANDIVVVDGTDGQLRLRIAAVDAAGSVIGAVWLNDMTVGQEYSGTHTTTLVSGNGELKGTGFKVDIKSALCSGRNGIAGKGGTIDIKSTDNLLVEASFSGNRIDTESINKVDQPILNKYNHFTTFLEFKQPEVIQVEIGVKISIVKDAPVSSGIVLQEVKNNINKLFNITPDYIGKGLKLSDIYSAVMKTQYVEWCKVFTPLDNIDIPKNGLMVVSSIDVVEAPISFK